MVIFVIIIKTLAVNRNYMVYPNIAESLIVA